MFVENSNANLSNNDLTAFKGESKAVKKGGRKS